MSDSQHIETHHAKSVNITPESSISFNLLAMFLGLMVGAGVTYGVSITRLNNQGEQIKEFRAEFKEFRDNVNELNNSRVRQEEINRQTVDALGDIKSLLTATQNDINLLRRGK